MKVLYIAAECKPFSKVGGVADVAGELPPALKEQGVEIEILTPLYESVDPRHWQPDETLGEYRVKFNGKAELVQVCKGMLKDVPVCFLKNKTYFEGRYAKPYIYSEKTPFLDDVLRFSFFSEACLQIIKRKNPDIVHINDWVLGYLFGRMELAHLPQKRVITIHNIGYQGNIWKEALKIRQHKDLSDAFGSAFDDPNYFDPETGQPNCFNALRLGLELCHMANTVSANYCAEVTQPEDQGRYFEGGKGLDKIAARLFEAKRLVGIINGFEYKFAPSEETFASTMEQKAQMKRSLSRYFRNPENLLIGFVGRAVEQKFKLLTERIDGKSVLEHILEIPGVNAAILATGLPEYENFISNLAVKRFDGPNRYDDVLSLPRRSNYSYVVAFDPEKARQISLGSDIFLMPSLFEPCGITQMESLSNATPPLVRWTGGLVDTVKPHTQADGTGFGFDGKNREEILRNLIQTVNNAVDLYTQEPNGFHRLQKNGFFQRFSWSNTAKRYIQDLYEPVLKGE